MATNPITLKAAAAAFLLDYGQRYSKSSRLVMLCHIRRFLRECPRTYLTEVTPYDLNHFLAQWEDTPRRLRTSAVNKFLLWASHRYGLGLPAAIQQRCRPERIVDAEMMRARNEKVKAAAERMLFPHQKAIFLCGFLHLWPLSRVCHATLSELRNLAQRDDFHALLIEIDRLAPRPYDSALFRTWLGGSVQSAEHRWHQWSPVQFRIVVKAGEDARMAAGIRGKNKLTWRLPVLSEENIQRLPRFWGND